MTWWTMREEGDMVDHEGGVRRLTWWTMREEGGQHGGP